jgi:DinB superfamily
MSLILITAARPGLVFVPSSRDPPPYDVWSNLRLHRSSHFRGFSERLVATMPIMRTIAVLPFLVVAITLRLYAAPMTGQDREHLLVHFEMTGQMLAEEVRGLSPAQLEYKSSPDRWSIRECVSHLAVAEPDYWRDLQKAVKGPADMKDKKSAATDADIMWYGIDRAVHTKTGGGHEKVDTYKNMGEALGKFQALHATMIAYIKTTDDDLRAHSFGEKEVIDCWQWMLEISTHAERHIQQIREIKADTNFPKK